MGTPNKQLKTGAELESLLEQLEDPFDPSEIKWRVTHTTRDGGRGAVVAFADQRDIRTVSTGFSPPAGGPAPTTSLR
jgi:hypothetical protein